jgi:hypothetical protein
MRARRQRLRRLVLPIGKANNLNEIRPGSMGDGRSDDAADLHYDRHSENGERAVKPKLPPRPKRDRPNEF